MAQRAAGAQGACLFSARRRSVAPLRSPFSSPPFPRPPRTHPQDTLLRLQEEHSKTGAAVGLDIYSGKPFLPAQAGVWDAQRVKRSIITLGTVLASQLLLVDEVLRAGRGTRTQ